MMIDRKKCIRCVLTCLLVLCLQMTMVIPSSAKITQMEATLVVGQEFTTKNGKKPSVSTEFNYILIPLESGTPMPEGTNTEGEYHFKLDGTEQIAIKINYDQVGLYQYKVELMIEKEYAAKGIGESIQTGDTVMAYQYGVVCGISLLVFLFIFGGRKKEYRIYCKK